jgi:hypothetical protein
LFGVGPAGGFSGSAFVCDSSAVGGMVIGLQEMGLEVRSSEQTGPVQVLCNGDRLLKAAAQFAPLAGFSH